MNAVNAHSLKRGLAGVLLGLGLSALAGCGDFHRLALLWEEPPAPLVLEITLDPAAPEEAAAVWRSGPAEGVEVEVSGGEAPRGVIVTIRIPAPACP